MAAQTRLHHLNALGNLISRAASEGKAKVNPVRLLHDKPTTADRAEAVWLEVGEAARFLIIAKERDASPHPRSVPFLHPLFSTALLTGGRKGEVLGLQMRDIDFERDTVRFRPNDWRRLKRPRHNRSVPLWPQLRAVLEEHVARREESGGLLFPSPKGGMLTDLRGSIGALTDAAKIGKHVTFHTFRHTYAATRLQTTDHGQPVSPFTVMRELGHSSLSLIEKTYGHLQSERSRIPVVEYRETQVVDSAARREAR